ncbi:anti-sigma regulatory factor (Ser/Thr protein kinase) [Krasilnikovia cinnamomea]|uniref:Anti-sigma regulatory factor (Ser/Thr protein kinase) n=1 Tax=Krasilnikovia cinnamomea TaxID=349313 RepID=A0A4V2G702_9ACTN|nr:ATP-binding protein [Krasilnikovia cinnamomea]RZU50706.1 anti-sigma regulatory factor (Ser/Thr protein kinase) [Krasilnikovia cinnamomea]
MHVTTRLSLPRHPSTVTRARQVLTTLLSLTGADEEVRGNLAVLISEACANAVTHSDPDSTVDVAIVIDDDNCQIEISNRGTAPDGAGLDAGLPADPLALGGRGLPFIAALADSAAFVTVRPGQVLLRMRKYLFASQLPQS